MRITTANAFDQAIDNLQSRQQTLSQAQIQMTAGKRVMKASDDPTAAADAERAIATQARSTAQQRALDASQNSMTLSDSALGNAADVMQQIRTDLVEAGNASLSDTDRQGLASDIQGLRNQLLGIANSSDGNGNYLFGGQGTSGAPFVDAPGGVQYQGVAGQLNSALPEDMPLTLDGSQSWLQARSGNGVFVTAAGSGNTGNAWVDAGTVSDPSAITGSAYTVQFSVSGGTTTYSILQDGNPTATANQPYTSGQAIKVDGMSFDVSGAPADGDTFTTAPSTTSLNVFDTLDSVVKSLQTPSQKSGVIQQAVNGGIRDLDQSMSSLSTLRSQVGQALNLADTTTSRLSAETLYGKTAESNDTDLDMVQAASDFSNQQTGYQAALQTYAMVQKTNLFQYLS